MHLIVPSIGFVYVGSNLIMKELKRRITGVDSSHVISLCDFAYYVVR